MKKEQKLQAIKQKIRRETPSANHPQFDAICEDYLPRLIALDPTAPEYRAIADTLHRRLLALRSLTLQHAPPALHREPGESARSYLARCYAAWAKAERELYQCQQRKQTSATRSRRRR